jgi:uncharacterized protein
MRTDWSRQVPVDTLVNEAREHEFEIPLRHLPRVAGSLAVPEGSATGMVRFWRDLGIAVAELTLHVEPQVVCQRCMQPLSWPIESRGRVALVTDLAAADRVPEGLETYLTEGDRVSVRELVEEEILLALPIVPKCTAGEACERMAAVDARAETVGDQERDESAPTTQTPFAELRELMKKE